MRTGIALATMTLMLSFCTVPLKRTATTYAAFRLAFLDTLERLTLLQQVDEAGAGGFGYLTEVPFLKNVAPRVQLDVLATTWAKHRKKRSFDASLVEESVIYAVCESAARVIQDDPESADHWLATGPRQFDFPACDLLAERVRRVHLGLPGDGDFLLISQFQDVPPDEAERLKEQFDLEPSACECMFDLLGRWRISPRFCRRASTLLTRSELLRAAEAVGATDFLQPQ